MTTTTIDNLTSEELHIIQIGLDREIEWLTYENQKQARWIANKANVPNENRLLYIEYMKRQLQMAKDLRSKLFTDPLDPIL